MKNSIFLKLLFPLITIAFILANFYLIKNALLGTLLTFIFIGKYGFDLGRFIFKSQQPLFQFIFGSLGLISGIGIFNTALFYIYKIDHFVFASSLIIVAAIAEFLTLGKELPTIQPLKSLLNFLKTIKAKPLIIIYLIFYLIEFFLVFKNRSAGIIASPWQLISKSFFVLFGLETFLLLLISYWNKKNNLPVILLILHTLLMSGVALIIYQIGYGYDPFLHLASEKLLLETGTITPKPLYYIGAYSIIIFLKNISQLPLDFLNKALLPISFSILLPAGLTLFLDSFKIKRKFLIFASLAALAVPLTYFINTTPQGLTNLLSLLIIFLSFPVLKRQLSIYYLLLLALITLAIHPLFGVPLTLFVIFLWLKLSKLTKKLKIGLQVVCALCGTIIFPILFWVNSIVNNYGIKFISNFQVSFGNPFHFKTMYVFLYDLLYTYGYNYKLLFLIFAIASALLLIKKGRHAYFRETFLFAGIFLINYLFMKYFIDLTFVVNQDKVLFLNRILELAYYFLMPGFVYAVYLLFRINFEDNEKYWNKLFFVIFLTLTLTMSLYFSYPIFDNYKNSKEYNVTQADIDTVHYIKDKSKGNYIVLANQMVAAAAIKEFGFEKYYNGNFYYSIPNGNEQNFYKYFEKMVFETPSKENALAAMQTAGVNQVYFVINKYWTNFPKIVDKAKLTADSWQEIDQGQNYIFFYSQK